MSKHTPEPWNTSDLTEGYTHNIVDAREDGRYPERFVAELPIDDYDRAIACVNAFAGIHDPAKALEDARKALEAASKELMAIHNATSCDHLTPTSLFALNTRSMNLIVAVDKALRSLTPSQDQKAL